MNKFIKHKNHALYVTLFKPLISFYSICYFYSCYYYYNIYIYLYKRLQTVKKADEYALRNHLILERKKNTSRVKSLRIPQLFVWVEIFKMKKFDLILV